MTDREAMRGVFLDTYPLDQGDVDLGPLAAPLSGLDRYERTAPEQLAERIADVEVVLLNKVRLDRAALTLAKRLKLVVLSATGTDNVDLDAAGELGVTVCNCRGYATASVVQHAIGLMLALTTRLIDYDRAVRAHLHHATGDDLEDARPKLRPRGEARVLRSVPHPERSIPGSARPR